MTSQREMDLRQVLLEGARDRLRSLGSGDRHEALLAVHSLHANAAAAGLTDLLPMLDRLEEELIESRPGAIDRARDAIQASLADRESGADDDLVESFDAEAAEHLGAVRLQLERLRRHPDEQRALEDAFRALHTFKGSAAMVGRERAAALAHRLEDLLQAGLGGGNRCDPSCLSGLEEGLSELEELVSRPERRESPSRAPEAREKETLAVDREVAEQHLVTSASILPSSPWPEAEAAGAKLGAALVPRRGSGAGMERSETTAVLRVPLIQTTRLLDSALKLQEIAAAAARIDGETRALSDELAAVQGELLELGRSDPGAVDLTRRLGRVASALGGTSDGLSRHSAALGRETRTIRTLVKGLRATTMAGVFKRLEGAAEEMARRLGRRLVVETLGGSIEIDRKLSAWVLDPLLHIVRNAVVHGIEDPAQRVALGKEPVGRLWLSASLRGDEVHLEVHDDGKGIETAALRNVLVARGVRSAAEAARASREELLQAIFLPGLSTRDEADQLAGRGMGLSAVRTEVARWGGKVDVESWSGRGTRFIVRVPRLSEIRKVLILRLGGQRLAIALEDVVGVALTAGSVELLPVAELLGLTRDPAARTLAVLLAREGAARAVLVDDVEGVQAVEFSFLGESAAALGPFLGLGVTADQEPLPVLDLTSLFPPPRDAPRPAPPRVMVAEDSPSARGKIATALAGAGFEVEPTADGLEAWTRLCCEPYDLLVTDLEMPRLHGLELIERLRSELSEQRLPVVVLSANGEAEVRARAEALGVHHFVLKGDGDEALTAAALEAVASGDDRE